MDGATEGCGAGWRGRGLQQYVEVEDGYDIHNTNI